VFTTYLENGFLTPSRTTGTSVGIGGVAISESSGLYIKETSDFETVTNLSVTLETTGKPVFVGLIGTQDALSYIRVQKVGDPPIASGFFRFRRGSTVISEVGMGAEFSSSDTVPWLNLPPTLFSCLDLAPAGTHTYTFQVRTVLSSDQRMVINNVRLMAYEL